MWKGSRSATPKATIRFLQDGAGRIAHGSGGYEQPYVPGEEYIVFLRDDPVSGRFLRLNGSGYVFPVREGRVDFGRGDAPGLTNGMPIDEFGRALQHLLTQSR
jgi:hypothetical protein